MNQDLAYFGHLMVSIHVAKDPFKFAAAHMTVFADGSKEALHGHNYQVSLEADLVSTSLAKMVSFHVLKAALKQVCSPLDEKVLLAKRCPFFKVLSQSRQSLEFELCKKRYVLPANEVVILDLENITVETLSEYLLESFVVRLKKADKRVLGSRISGLRLRVDESHGQGATCRREDF